MRMEEFSKKICGISTYVKWNFKPQISSIFNFDRASDGRMAHVLGVNAWQHMLTKEWKEGAIHLTLVSRLHTDRNVS